MQTDFLRLVSAYLNGIWSLFTSWKFPYLNFTPAQFLFFCLVMPLAVQIVKSIISMAITERFGSSGERDKKK